MTTRDATVRYPVMEAVRKRWSPCVFANRPVESAKLHSLFEAARWAPSCYNEQPWSFILGIKDQGDAYDRILGCLVEQNQAWAAAAPVLGISVSCLHFRRNQKPNKEAVHDVGLAMGQLNLEAISRELCVHQMAGFHEQQAVKELHIPEGYQPVAAFAIGYPGDPSEAPDALRERDESPRVRKEQGEFVFDGFFDHRWEG